MVRLRDRMCKVPDHLPLETGEAAGSNAASMGSAPLPLQHKHLACSQNRLNKMPHSVRWEVSWFAASAAVSEVARGIYARLAEQIASPEGNSRRYPRRRPDRRHGAGDESPRPPRLLFRSPLRRVAGAEAEGLFDRGPTVPREHHPRGQRHAAPSARQRRHGGDPARQAGPDLALAAEPARSKIQDGGRRRPGQQDGAHRVGDDD
jgi:hypothetical protein